MSVPASTSSRRRSHRISQGSHPYKNPTKRTSPLAPSPSRVSKNEPQCLPTTEAGPQTLYLRVNQKFLRLFPDHTADQPNPQPLLPPPGTTGNLIIIRANLPDLSPFAGDTVDWLIKVARLIFEPLGTSSLYTFTTQSLEWWLDREMEPSLWRRVVHGEQLRATIYEFCPDNDASIMLTKMSLRQARSVTTDTSVPRATAFRNTLLQRDKTCVITHHTRQNTLAASHLLPRRLGDAGVQSACQRFTGSSTIVDRFDPLIGVLLFAGLDLLMDTYELGFWNYGPNQYVLHSFVDPPVNLYGAEPVTANEPMCHGYRITLSTHDSSLDLPPVGVFNWHYAQCILKKFSTDAYRAITNIYYFVLPFHTRDDDDESDVDFDDERNITNPPYPSYLWELAELRARQHLEAVERNRAIVTWNSGVS